MDLAPWQVARAGAPSSSRWLLLRGVEPSTPELRSPLRDHRLFGGNFDIGPPNHAMQIRGGLSLEAGLPTASGRLAVHTASRLWDLPLPAVQFVPFWIRGALAWELRMRLFSGRF